MAGKPQTDTVKLKDGNTISLARLPDIDEPTWDEVKTYLAQNPEMAKNLERFARNPEAMRGWFQTQAIAEHYAKGMQEGSEPLQEKMKSLQSDPELAPMFEDIKKNGLEVAMRHWQDEELMLKISKKMGSLPQELDGRMKEIEETPLSFHEAAMKGDLKAVNEYLQRKQPLDVQDYKGITPLGYAIGANRIAIVKLLLDKRANPFAVDSTGNCGLHYAAGYGRRELLEYLLQVGVHHSQRNSQGQTPMDVASLNKQAATIEILRARGAQ